MPRPSKHVSPDTLGGRIRAARESLHLSLADVANGHYSTSLISQIERNRIEPSQESLRFLADRLRLPLADLEVLAQQHLTAENSAQQYKSYEDLRLAATRLLSTKDTVRALALLYDLHFSLIPPAQHWRLAALRGQCYFEQRKFLKAQQDFAYAVNEHPEIETMSPEQKQELLLLYLHLAGTYRELHQLEAALEHYKITLQMISREVPFGYVAEVHWGIALIAYAQANEMPSHLSDRNQCRDDKLKMALEHAENACILYRSIGEQLRAAAVTCQIALIEQALGDTEKVQVSLKEILTQWSYILSEPVASSLAGKRQQQEIASIVASAACSLAGIKLDEQDYDQALTYVDQALAAGHRSYKIRRANAYLMQGRILVCIDPKHPGAEEAFRKATEELADTQRIAARISAHVRLGRHLLHIGKTDASEQELEQARLLSDLVSASTNTSTLTEDIPLA